MGQKQKLIDATISVHRDVRKRQTFWPKPNTKKTYTPALSQLTSYTLHTRIYPEVKLDIQQSHVSVSIEHLTVSIRFAVVVVVVVNVHLSHANNVTSESIENWLCLRVCVYARGKSQWSMWMEISRNNSSVQNHHFVFIFGCGRNK